MSSRGAGRGEYYKNKYGGGGRGNGGGGGGGGDGRGGGGGGGGGRGEYYRNRYGGRSRASAEEEDGGAACSGGASGGGAVDRFPMKPLSPARSGTGRDLVEALHRVNNRPYGAYRDIEGTYAFDGFVLSVDHVQSDPFAPPSRMHVVLPAVAAAFPEASRATRIRRTALCDFLTRAFHAAAAKAGADRRTESGGWSGAKGGEITIDCPGQHVLERTSVLLHPDGTVEARFTVALPARGRNICGTWCAEILTQGLPALVGSSLRFDTTDRAALERHLVSVEDQAFLREALPAAGAVAFVADGAVLPRESGASDRRMSVAEAVAFSSPPSLQRKFTMPSGRVVAGMAIPPGVTLIVGGGFHGKSTLLKALEVGVYNHIPGDGREFVVCDPTAVKVRAEDGRSVTSVDISPFIANLPFGRSTAAFSTPDASGSTSQATNIVEAVEAGAGCLLIDEDTSATNLMIRDARMQMLVAPEKEPITPFIAKVKPLYARLRVSTILVVGGAGDYFEVADTVVAMDCYKPADVTAAAHRIARECRPLGPPPAPSHTEFYLAGSGGPAARRPQTASFTTDGKVMARGKDKLQYGEVDIDLSAVEQLVEVSQTRAIGDAIRCLVATGMPKRLTVPQLLDRLDAEMDEEGLDVIAKGAFVSNLARPRRFEIAAALNRFRGAAVAISHGAA